MYPVMIQMKGKPCLVVGGGAVALRKIRTLLEEGAAVTVIAPDPCDAVKAFSRQGQIRLVERSLCEDDCRGYALVITATGRKEAALMAASMAGREGFLYNAADFPELGNCFIPARIRRGHLTVTVSTDGKSPAVAAAVKRWLDETMPDGFAEWLDRVAVIRRDIKKRKETPKERQFFWEHALGKPVMELVAMGKLEKAEEVVRLGIGSFRDQS
ncbi:MAG: bifunctional precorrin-2 dehydrogenase/sirohydrochlorin ferrochelatase [Dialister sp.]|nr:bifunctional precorrin-2 dehydrogenase/sirohydrochlorin ferrochelatase [Dialister sp.]